MKKQILPVVVAAILATMAIATLFFNQKKLSSVPELSLNIIDGRKIELQALKGKPLLVTFWATTCSTCIKEIPHLIKLYNDLGNDVFEIIAIAMPYDPPNLVVSLSKRENLPYPVALDIQGEAVKAFGNVQVTPTSFLIDSQGNIVEEQAGEIDIKELKQKVIALQKTKTSVS